MNAPQSGQASSPPPSEVPTPEPFVPPEGWTRSPNITTSRFAFEMSNTTRWYTNDGQGNGYFAPGWDNERIARRTGVFRWIAVVLAALMLAAGAVLVTTEYGEQIEYTQLRAGGVETTGVVTGPVTVEHSTHRPRDSGRRYTTRTTAPLEYIVNGQAMQGEITESSSETSSIWATAEYPGPAWAPGQELTLYADPAKPERFVLFHEYKEADADSLPRGVTIVLIATAVLLLLPLALFIAGVRNIREARKL